MIETFKNILTLFMTDFGLLGCTFAYIKAPKRKYFYFSLFFLFNFLSEYYRTVYALIIGRNPSSSSLIAQSGWNIGWLFLLLAIFTLKSEESRQYFHPVMLLPVIINIYQAYIYKQTVGLANSLYQTIITTIITVLCLQELLYANKNKGLKRPVHAAGITLSYLLTEYILWISTYFTFKNPLLDPSIYFTLIKVILMIVFASFIQKDEEKPVAINWEEFRYRLFYQGIISLVILIASVIGYLSAEQLNIDRLTARQAESYLTYIIAGMSAILVLLILGALYAVRNRYTFINTIQQRQSASKRARTNIIMSVSITFIILFGTMLYNAINIYTAGVSDVYENKKQDTAVMSEEAVHYIGRATTAVQSVAETVSFMRNSGSSTKEIQTYLADQAISFAHVPDNHFINFYAYINGEYIDASNWKVPEDYDPTKRDWYVRTSVEPHAPVIIPPYADVESQESIITVAQNISLSPESKIQDIVCIDIDAEYVQELLIKHADASDTGIIINGRGDIIACTNPEYISLNIANIFGEEMLDVLNTDEPAGHINLNDTEYALNIRPMLIDLKLIMLTDLGKMFNHTYARVTIAVLAGMISIGLVLLIYYFNYKVEEYSISKISSLNGQITEALAQTIDAKDKYTNGHSSRVAKYAKMIAAEADYDEAMQEDIYMMGLLHDVGKIGIPDAIITKPSKLTDEEFALIKTHPIMGAEILQNITENPKLAQAARWHHERYDGTGYPDHLKGEDIPLEVRIISVADAYDAMTSARNYRDIMSQQKVREEIVKGSGKQFDPHFAGIMTRLIDQDKNYELKEK